MDRVSSKVSLIASVGMFKLILCFGVETSSWQKRRGSWLGELALGRHCCPYRWEAELKQGASGARRVEDCIPLGTQGFWR